MSNDKRFDKLFKDPKFKSIPKKVRKVEVNDTRFSHMFTDNKFASHADTDEYGQKLKKSNYNKELEDFYTSNNITIEGKNKVSKKQVEEQSNSSFEYNTDEYAGENDESDTSQEFEDFLDQHVEEQNREVDAWDKYNDKEVPTGDVTKKLAIMNLNWESINANDLFILFNSLSPKPNMIKSVYIYPSEFGIKEKEKEVSSGPDKEIFKTNKNKEKDNIIIHSIDDYSNKIETNEGLDTSKLRAYELKKLKFYYAVVEFKSLKISNYIYENYDGMEIERTQMFMEMRFVPDDLEFPYKPRESCLKFPENYEQNIKPNRALDHSKVTLTWDQDDLKRQDLLKKAFSSQFKEEEIQELLVSSSSEEDEDLANALFDDKDEEEANNAVHIIKNKNKRGKEIKEGDTFDIVFPKGFEGLDKNIQNEKNIDIKDKSLFQQYQERKKVRGKELKMEEKLRREEKKTKREKYNDKNLNLLSYNEDDNNNTKFNSNDDGRFAAVKSNKDYWVDPTSTEYRKKNKNK